MMKKNNLAHVKVLMVESVNTEFGESQSVCVKEENCESFVGDRLREALDSRQVSLDFVLWKVGINDGFLAGRVTPEL